MSSIEDRLENAYNLGYNSYYDKLYENPFDVSVEEYNEWTAWYDGYQQASDDHIALEIFSEGYHDFLNGVSIENSPYNTEDHNASWCKGWNSAMRDSDFTVVYNRVISAKQPPIETSLPVNE